MLEQVQSHPSAQNKKLKSTVILHPTQPLHDKVTSHKWDFSAANLVMITYRHPQGKVHAPLP